MPKEKQPEDYRYAHLKEEVKRNSISNVAGLLGVGPEQLRALKKYLEDLPAKYIENDAFVIYALDYNGRSLTLKYQVGDFIYDKHKPVVSNAAVWITPAQRLELKVLRNLLTFPVLSHDVIRHRIRVLESLKNSQEAIELERKEAGQTSTENKG